jgi:hypothetical protein
MKILLGSWFTLPRLGTAAFSALMKQGVKYDRALGFKLDVETDLGGALTTLRSALGEEVELNLRCIVDGKEACPGCRYSNMCDRTRVSPLCLCAEHASGTDAFDTYSKAYAQTLVS